MLLQEPSPLVILEVPGFLQNQLNLVSVAVVFPAAVGAAVDVVVAVNVGVEFAVSVVELLGGLSVAVYSESCGVDEDVVVGEYTIAPGS